MSSKDQKPSLIYLVRMSFSDQRDLVSEFFVKSMQQGGYDVTRKTFEIDPFFAEYTNARSGFLILNLALKRAFDFIGALVALACFAPLFIVVAIAIKLTRQGRSFSSKKDSVFMGRSTLCSSLERCVRMRNR